MKLIPMKSRTWLQCVVWSPGQESCGPASVGTKASRRRASIERHSHIWHLFNHIYHIVRFTRFCFVWEILISTIFQMESQFASWSSSSAGLVPSVSSQDMKHLVPFTNLRRSAYLWCFHFCYDILSNSVLCRALLRIQVLEQVKDGRLCQYGLCHRLFEWGYREG